MGFKLKIGLLSYLTAENISWHKKSFPIAHLCFGVDLHQTKLVAPGKLPAIQVIKFYQDPKNKKAREKQLRLTLKKTKNREDIRKFLLKEYKEQGFFKK